MPGIDETGRPSTVRAGNSAMTLIIGCLRRLCVECADTLVPYMQSNTRSVSLIALESIALSILLIPPGRVRSTDFVDLFVEFMNQVHGFRTFGPNLESNIVRECRAEIRIVVNQIFTIPPGMVPVVARETLVLILPIISDSDTRNELFDSWLLFLSST